MLLALVGRFATELKLSIKASKTNFGAAVGQKSNAKVKEILRHGFLEKTAALERDTAGVAYRHFCTVWGVGPRRAQVWVDRGLRTLDDIRNSEECMAELSSRERTGMRHAEDFRVRIPRQVCAVPLSQSLLGACT